MEIQWMCLKNFRNYDYQQINFSKGLNIIQGQNGQGKTNILEGIYYLLMGKSYRVRREQELIRWGENNFHLYGNFLVSKRLLKLESHFGNSKKVIKINQVPCQRLSDYVGTINVVFFSPDDLMMVKGGPSERRRFIDLHISQLNPKHVHLLNSYNKVIKQKNALLKNAKIIQNSQVELWNDQIIKFGSQIIKNRWEYTERLSKTCIPIYNQISSSKEEYGMKYISLGKSNIEETLESFPRLLEEKMTQEIERRMVLIGPHRDDILFELNGKPSRLYASQGQQRSIVLSLKLGEMEVIKEEKGEYPILLLDDVLSELDNFRREYLIRTIGSLDQCILTMTTAESSTFEGATIFEVEKGKIKRRI